MFNGELQRMSTNQLLFGIEEDPEEENEDFFLKYKVLYNFFFIIRKKSKRKVQGVPQLQTTAFPRHQEEEKIDKCKQAQIEQTYEKH